jgi:voltage-gated potassium channel
MPDQIGGFYMATLVTKPDAVEFFSFLTSKSLSDIGFEEICYETAPDKCKDTSIRDLTIRKSTGANIIGYKDPSGHYHVNPEPHTRLIPGSSFILLGSRQQLNELKKYLNS